jgi:hypothetical protein
MVGLTRVKNISEILVSLGFLVKYGAIEDDDVDIWVYDSLGFLVLVIEVTNWRRSSYMSKKKAESIKRNFEKYSCPKLFVCSFHNNYLRYGGVIGEGVDILVVGFQTQPFYEWFSGRGEADGMRPDDDETREIVRRKIKGYLEEIRLI